MNDFLPSESGVGRGSALERSRYRGREHTLCMAFFSTRRTPTTWSVVMTSSTSIRWHRARRRSRTRTHPHVLDTLLPRQADLRDGRPLANQSVGCSSALVPPPHRRARSARPGRSAIPALALVQRNRDDQRRRVAARCKRVLIGPQVMPPRPRPPGAPIRLGPGIVRAGRLVLAERHGARRLRLEVAAAVATAIADEQLRAGQPVAEITHCGACRGSIAARHWHTEIARSYRAECDTIAIRREEDGENVGRRVRTGTVRMGTLPSALCSSLALLLTHSAGDPPPTAAHSWRVRPYMSPARGFPKDAG